MPVISTLHTESRHSESSLCIGITDHCLPPLLPTAHCSTGWEREGEITDMSLALNRAMFFLNSCRMKCSTSTPSERSAAFHRAVSSYPLIALCCLLSADRVQQ
jgi:hypothetical protein